ncbi:MAG: arylsulfatase [Planctomycetaceae bacterium]
MPSRLARFAVLAALLASPLSAAERPNVVVILGDDMGWSDLGCYGGESETPTLDSLAAGGLRFTQFYNTARCCPTRASLLTGLYPHQAGVGHMMEDRGHDGYRGNLNDNCVTIAEALKPAGYGTYAVGKWHVTRNTAPDGPKHNWPLQRGFDRYYGTIHGAGSYWDPSSLTRDNTQISPFADSKYTPETFYYTNAISDHSVRFIEEHDQAKPDDPLFLYVAFTAAHWPMHALPEDIERFKGRYAEGYGAIREARYERLKEMGLIDPAWELSPQAKEWGSVEPSEWEQRCMEVYAAMIYRMDAGIGEIVASLKETGRFDNTLILFLQDNGGCAEEMGRKGNAQHPDIPRPEAPTLDPVAATDFINGGSVPHQTRDGYPVRMGKHAMPGPADTYVGYGEGWANVSTTPFRLYKHWVHEGGISTPLIAHWPQGIARKGELETQPGHLIDVMATCLDLSGATYPKEKNGKPVPPPEGRSLVPAFNGEAIDREAIYWEHESNRAIRVGDWKLVSDGRKGTWELYDMANDRTEMHDLASQHPEKVKELAAKWQAYAERANVLPLGTWKKEPVTKFSKKKRFELAGDGSLPREKAPHLVDHGFAVEVTLNEVGKNGVLAAQGGRAHGWALYQQDGKLHFMVRHPSRLFGVSVDAPALGGTESLNETLRPDGHVTLTVGGSDGTTVNGKAATVRKMPLNGLEVGRDEGDPVGDYDGTFPYDGEIENVVVELID